MNFKKVCELIYSDYRRYRAVGGNEAGSLLGTVLLTQGLWASIVYRLSHAIATNKQPSSMRRVARILFLFFEKFVEVVTSVRIPGECSIGKGLYIGHFGPIVIHPDAVLGDFCNISQGTTIGVVQRGTRTGVPVIGSRVYIGPNTVVIGGITIEDDVAIGAGAVVTRSAPARAVLVGNPARAISQQGSFEFVRYDGMEQDPERAASIALREGSE